MLREPIEGRVLITGGTGFIGSALAHHLLAGGVGVDVLTRDRDRALHQFGGRVRAVENLTELEHDTERPPPAAIVNLAGKNLGEERWNDRVRRELVDSRLSTTQHVIDYIAHARPAPELLISGSAVGYYGARGGERLDEESAPGDEFQSQLCNEWELSAQRAAERGVRVCLSRTGVVLGPGGGVLSQLASLFRKGLGAIVGSGDQWVSWIALDDLVELYVDCMRDASLSGPFNNTAPQPVTHREFAKTLGEVVHRPVLLRVPGPMLRLVIGEMAHLQLTGQRVCPQRHLERGFSYRFAGLAAAMEVALARATSPHRQRPSRDRADAAWHRGQ